MTKTFTPYEEKVWLTTIRRRGAAARMVYGPPPGGVPSAIGEFVPIAIGWVGLDGGLRWSELP